jgi:hypothetical protein
MYRKDIADDIIQRDDIHNEIAKKQEELKKRLNSGAPRLNTQKRAIDRRVRPPQIQTTDMDHQVQFTHVRYKIPIPPQTAMSNESQPITLEHHHLSAPLR